MKWNLVLKKVCQLIEHSQNPRQISERDYESLKESVRKFGLSEKIVINTDNTIIGGHQRKRVLEDLLIYEVECWCPERELTDEEVRELNIRFNKNHGQWDWDILANFFEPDDLCEWGFTQEQLDVDLGTIHELDMGLEGEEEPEKKKKDKGTCPNCGFDLN